MGIITRTIVEAKCDCCGNSIDVNAERYVDYTYAGKAFCIGCLSHTMTLERAIYLLEDGENIFIEDQVTSLREEFKHRESPFKGVKPHNATL